ncbi:SPARC [Erpetoichthys calabaricus]|uniref:SPARC n=1 Tax=Erpetoichthys calabaricus TaxID=27687 RepID=UPI00109F69AE|nr:SPARC [Erpetoichthys calabaricus]
MTRLRRQQLEEERLRPYIGRVEPEELCQLLKCHKPAGSWCQVVEENGIRIPRCVCPKTCPSDRAPVCSVLGKSYENACLFHKESCRKRRRTGLAHQGFCIAPWTKCSKMEFAQFPYRLLDWFLLLSQREHPQKKNGTSLPLNCLSYEQRKNLAERHFASLDRKKNGKLSRRDLRKILYRHMPLEHCATSFFKSCDMNGNKKITLNEWTKCLVDRSENWYQDLMSVKMGSKSICPQNEIIH